MENKEQKIKWLTEMQAISHDIKNGIRTSGTFAIHGAKITTLREQAITLCQDEPYLRASLRQLHNDMREADVRERAGSSSSFFKQWEPGYEASNPSSLLWKEINFDLNRLHQALTKQPKPTLAKNTKTNTE